MLKKLAELPDDEYDEEASLSKNDNLARISNHNKKKAQRAELPDEVYFDEADSESYLAENFFKAVNKKSADAINQLDKDRNKSIDLGCQFGKQQAKEGYQKSN